MAEDKKNLSKAEQAKVEKDAKAKDTTKKTDQGVGNAPKTSGNNEGGFKGWYQQHKTAVLAGGVVSVFALSLGLGLGLGLKPKQRDFMFICDSGIVEDSSFNAAGWKGTRDFATMLEMTAGNMEPGNASEFASAYRTAFNTQEAKVAILSGWEHEIHWIEHQKNNPNDTAVFIDNGQSSLTRFVVKEQVDNFYENGNNAEVGQLLTPKERQTAINGVFGWEPKPTSDLVDETKLITAVKDGDIVRLTPTTNDLLDDSQGDVTNLAVAGDFNNTYGLTFSTEEAAFKAGLQAWMHASLDSEGNERPSEDKVVGGWAGFVSRTTGDFLSGFEHGLEIMNNLNDGVALLDSPVRETSRENDTAGHVKLVTPTSTSINDGSATSKDWESGSFDLGDGVTYAEALVTKGAKVILPVAGPQTEDALKTATSEQGKANDTLVLGVDTDATIAFANYAPYVLSTVEKNITSSTLEMLHIWGVENDYVTLAQYEAGGVIANSFEPSITAARLGETTLTKEDINKENAKVLASKRNLDNDGVGVTLETGQASEEAFFDNFASYFEPNVDSSHTEIKNSLTTSHADYGMEKFLDAVFNLAITTGTWAVLADFDGTINAGSATFFN